MKLRLQPVHVYCLHHVCEVFDANSMNKSDWMQINKFKNRITAMRHNGVEFISLKEAYYHILHDTLRTHKYAVLTFDDGYASVKEILPWLKEQHIPATLFITGKYLDGKSYRSNPQEKYLTYDEVFSMKNPLFEIANHGWEHTDLRGMTMDGFISDVKQNIDVLSKHPNYIPFWAYPYGIHADVTDEFLRNNGLTPLYVDAGVNYNSVAHINRELMS